MQSYTIHQGSATDVLPRLPQVHCVVTSPPYYNLRAYGTSIAELGAEPTLSEYVDNLVRVFQAVPLHQLGSVWVNLGDTRRNGSLLMVPERFALAMVDAGWILSDKVVWAKVVDHEDGSTSGACMVEPATRRLNGNGHEFLYRFTKQRDAWADTCAVALRRQDASSQNPPRYLPEELMSSPGFIEGRSLHNVWRIPPGQTKNKHYAVYPPALCERPIAMTCPMYVNPDGTFRTRIVEKQVYDEGRKGSRVFGKYENLTEEGLEKSGRSDTGRGYVPRKPVTLGWTDLQTGWTPGIVLDPFCGTGTTGEVALKLGRSFIGIDLYEEYARIATIRGAAVMENMVKRDLNPFAMCR